MSDIQSLLRRLQDNNPNERYDACEELRVMVLHRPLPQEAIDALVSTTNDPNPNVADAAQRALALHGSIAKSEPIQAQAGSSGTDNEKQDVTRAWLLVTSFVFGATSLVCTFPVLLASVMTSDTATTGVDRLIRSVILFPVLSLLSIILSWGLYQSKKYTGARLVSLLPLIAGLMFISAWAEVSQSLEESSNISNECTSPVFDGGDGLNTTHCFEASVRPQLELVWDGTTASTLEAHNWQFSAHQGKEITIFVQTFGPGCPAVRMRILDPQGLVIEEFGQPSPTECTSDTITDSQHIFYPTLDGIYVLRIDTPEFPGNYGVAIIEAE